MGGKFVASLVLTWAVCSTADAGCGKCSDLSKIEGNLDSNLVNCSCDDDNIPAKKPHHTLASSKSDNLTEAIEEVILKLIYGKQEESVDSILHLFSVLSLDALADSKDAQILREALERNLREVLVKFTMGIGVFFNPFITKNSKVNLACRGDHMCILNGLLDSREKILVRIISDLVPDVIDGLIGVLGELEGLKTRCGEKECGLIKALVDNKEYEMELLQDSKALKDFIAKYTVALVSVVMKTDMKPDKLA